MADPALTPQQQSIADALDAEFVKEVDSALFANTDPSWRKVAMVVGLAMMNAGVRRRGLPDLYYASRVRELVRVGKLEGSGDFSRMKYSEVKRP